MAEFVLTLSCPDRPGIVRAVAAYLYQAGCNVLDSQQFGDRIAGQFFMRVHVETVPGAATTFDSLYSGFTPVAAEFAMGWELHDTAVQPRVLIMVSRAGHCLNDLLYRRAAEALRIDVPLVVGNHPDLAPLGWSITDPEPAARACVALRSDGFPATTGESVHVDGGLHAMGA